MSTAKLKFSSLYFVSRNTDKHKEYIYLTGIKDLTLSLITVTEPQIMILESLVDEKIKAVVPKLPDNPFFVEHTALSIDAWQGLPGGLTHVFMEYVGSEGICKMMHAYRGEERTAKARLMIGYHHKRLGNQTFQGEVTGRIAPEPRGANGFGWDSIFIPDGESSTYAQMTLEEKNRTSMRRQAAEKFMEYLHQHYDF